LRLLPKFIQGETIFLFLNSVWKTQ
jgi:hypothetical protein